MIETTIVLSNMKPEKKGQIIGSIIGLLIGCAIAFLLWGFSSPGGIVILVGAGIGGIFCQKISYERYIPVMVKVFSNSF